MFFFNSSIVIILQIICVVHCLRKGKSTMWIWVIVFLPLVGSIAYIFIEMFNRADVQNVQSGVSAVFNPTGRIKKLEEQLRFSDTFSNRVNLADAYLAIGQTEKAIRLYEGSLTGAFIENEHVLTQLSAAYFQVHRYTDVIAINKKICKLPQYPRSKAHLLYAMALEQTGSNEMAEKEYRLMKIRFDYFEARYRYGLFLAKNNRIHEAHQIFTEMVDEFTQLSSREKRNNREWVNSAKEQLRKLSLQPV